MMADETRLGAVADHLRGFLAPALSPAPGLAIQAAVSFSDMAAHIRLGPVRVHDRTFKTMPQAIAEAGKSFATALGSRTPIAAVLMPWPRRWR